MKNQTKVIIISLFGFIVSVGLFLSVIKPTLTKVDEHRRELIAKKTELKQLEEQITIFKNSQKDLSEASGKEVISGSLLVREDLQFAIEKVEEAAELNNVLESMVIVDNEGAKPNASKDLISGKSFLSEVPYTLSTSSDFKQFVDFMRYLEHLPHFTEVSKISLRSSSSTANSDGLFVHSDTVIGSIDSVFFIQKK